MAARAPAAGAAAGAGDHHPRRVAGIPFEVLAHLYCGRFPVAFREVISG